MGPHVLASGRPQKMIVAHSLHRRQVDDVMTRVPGGAAVSVSGTSTLVHSPEFITSSNKTRYLIVRRRQPRTSQNTPGTSQ